jgi:hypothetical protein
MGNPNPWKWLQNHNWGVAEQEAFFTVLAEVDRRL